MLDLFDGTIQVRLERQENLVNVSVIINESNSGNYSVGELRFDVTSGCKDWFEQDPENKAKLAGFLVQVAEKIVRE